MRKKYIATILLTPFFLFLILILLINFFNEKLPAPRISSSESFNEKARWIKNNIHNGCDILIIGSSMALNNIDGNLIKKSFPENSILNTGSWGLNVSESKKMLEHIIPICHPKIIIYPAYFGDFDNQWNKAINWPLFGEYISNKSILNSYLESLDAQYYISPL